MFGEGWIGAWARTQPCLALSSAESEYYALVVAAQEGMMLQSIMKEFGIDLGLVLRSDSTAAKQAVEKPGVMRMKHLALKALFLKQLCQTGVLSVQRVGTKENPADLLTKPVTAEALQRCHSQIPSWRVEHEVQMVQHGDEILPLESLTDEERELFRLGQNHKAW